MSRLLDRLTLGVLAWKLGVLLLNAATFPRLRPLKSGPQRVSVLIPARDEADNLRRTLPALLGERAVQSGEAEIIVLDDESRDGTAELARNLGVRVLRGQPLPDGWRGKNWACWQLAGAAAGEWLLFTDADVLWHAGALDAVLAEAERTRADLLSVWPRQTNRTPGERLLTPLLDNLLLCWFPAPLARLPFRDASAAIGQVMLFRRAAYLRLGGHAAVRGELMEDMALARAIKGVGGRLGVALGSDLLTVRMYRSYPQSAEGIAKMTLPFHRGWRWALPLTWALHALVYLRPWLLRQPLPAALGLLEGLLLRRVLGRVAPADLLEVLLTPLLPLLAAPVYVQAARKNVRWKGREYLQSSAGTER